MTTEPILESGMQFGPFPIGECFYIEQSGCYKKIQDGVKMAEFLLLRHSGAISDVWIVEAKSSSPRPTSHADFLEFVDDIREKFLCAFHLGTAAILRRHEGIEDELSDNFLDLDLSKVGFRFILVIKGHKADWLPPLQDALARALRGTVRSWKLHPSAVLVMNDQLAREKGLVFNVFG